MNYNQKYSQPFEELKKEEEKSRFNDTKKK